MTPCQHTVYPRVGGETAEATRRAVTRDQGLSPRGRGNHGVQCWAANKSGSIPAWAGKPWNTALSMPDVLLGSIPAWAGKPVARMI